MLLQFWALFKIKIYNASASTETNENFSWQGTFFTFRESL